MDASCGAVLLAMLFSFSCLASPPRRSPGLQEKSQSAAEMLGREYHELAGELGPLPGRVVGLLMPAQSKWGRSLEWIGESVASHPESYLFPGDEKRAYELYAFGLAPRLLRVDGSPVVVPSKKNARGLFAEAHLVEVEFGDGFGTSGATTYEGDATGLKILDKHPTYPRSAVQLLDAARAEFDRFLRTQKPQVQRILAAERASFAKHVAPPPTSDQVTDVLFPSWDDKRKRLVVLFHRRTMRLVRGSKPCEIVYEGMPPEPSSVPFRYGYGVGLGQRLELDAQGNLVSVTHFTPAPIRIAPESGLDARRGFEPCPGSPALSAHRQRYPLPIEENPEEPAGRCGNGEKEAPEECDGADFGGQSCAHLGFTSGSLRCTPSCAISRDLCQATTGAAAKLQRRAVTASWGGVARLPGGRLAVATASAQTVQVHVFSSSTLVPEAHVASWTLPPDGSDLSFNAPVAAQVGSNLLLAVERNGQPSRSYLLALSNDGRISDTTTRVRGRVAFIAPRGDEALIGAVVGRNLETMVVGADGKPQGRAAPAVLPIPGSGYIRGGAVSTETGWLASMGDNGAYVDEVRFAALNAEGRLANQGEAKVKTGQVVVARGNGTTFVVQTHPAGVVTTEVKDSGAVVPPRVVGRGQFSWLPAATVQGDRLIVWASDGALRRVQRLELNLTTQTTSARNVLTLPLHIPVSAVVEGDTLILLFQAADVPSGAMSPALWLYRGP